MAKKSAIEKNKTRIKKVEKYAEKRKQLKKIIMNKETSAEDRFQAVVKLSALPKTDAQLELEIGVSFLEGLEGFTEELNYLE